MADPREAVMIEKLAFGFLVHNTKKMREKREKKKRKEYLGSNVECLRIKVESCSTTRLRQASVAAREGRCHFRDKTTPGIATQRRS